MQGNDAYADLWSIMYCKIKLFAVDLFMGCELYEALKFETFYGFAL